LVPDEINQPLKQNSLEVINEVTKLEPVQEVGIKSHILSNLETQKLIIANKKPSELHRNQRNFRISSFVRKNDQSSFEHTLPASKLNETEVSSSGADNSPPSLHFRQKLKPMATALVM